jgi:hypothetical protein
MRLQLCRQSDWVVISQTDCVLHWADHETEHLIDDRQSFCRFVSDCARFLPDPRAQTKIDIPRMSLRINGQAVDNIHDLDQVIAPGQRPLLHVLCNQVLLGQAYECAMTGLDQDYLVCECVPGLSAQVDLLADEMRAPFSVHTIVASKQMRVMHLDTYKSTPLTLNIYLSLRHDIVEIGASRVKTQIERSG